MTTQTQSRPNQQQTGERNRAALVALLDKSKTQIAAALPKHLTAERMIRMAVTLFNRNPGLQTCTPLSILAGVIQSSELGLEMAGPLGQAYLVPYWNKHIQAQEAQFQVGYRGFQSLAFRSGKVIAFPGHVVYSNDVFDYDYGSLAIKHKPARGDRGEIVCVYSALFFRGGGKDFEVMSRAEIEAHRARYSKQRSADGPWVTAWEEMAKKTVIRRLAKRAPISVELVRAAVLDEYAEAGLGVDLTGTLAALPAPDSNGSHADALAEALERGTGREAEYEPIPPKEPSADEAQQAELERQVDDLRDEIRQAESLEALDGVQERIAVAQWLSKEKRGILLHRVGERRKEITKAVKEAAAK